MPRHRTAAPSAAAAPLKAKDSTIEVAYDPRVTQTRALFKQLDIDGSGVIESAEMALLASSLCSYALLYSRAKVA